MPLKKWSIEIALIAILLILVALQILAFQRDSVSIEVSSQSVPVEVAVSKPLYCFDATNVALESSTVAIGCPRDTHSLGADPVPGHPSEATQLDSTLAIRFIAAQAIAKKEGIPLSISSGFRTSAVQARLFAEEVKKVGSEEEAIKWVLPPTISHHPQGTAIDVNYNFDRPSTKWLEINGYKFGLCRAYANEWWHFEAITSPGTPCPAMKVNASVDVAAANK